jgi:hypothetical protein
MMQSFVHELLHDVCMCPLIVAMVQPAPGLMLL